MACPARPRFLASGWVLLVLLWALGQALALGHRLGHDAGHHGHERAAATHLVGGEHEDGDAQCRLADEAGLGEVLLLAALPLPSPAARPAAPRTAPASATGAPGWRSYEARAPPTA